MFARSLVSAALLALGVSVLPSAGLAEPVKATGATHATPSAFQIPQTIQLSAQFAKGNGFNQAALGSVPSAMWPQLVCVVIVTKPYCWIVW